jgi:hypothetical protein
MAERDDGLTIHVPADAAIRLRALPSEMIPGGSILRWVVIVARPPLPADLSALSAPGGVSVLLAPDPGAVWPDAADVAAVREMLARRGAVAFAKRPDAAAFKRRLEKARSRA